MGIIIVNKLEPKRRTVVRNGYPLDEECSAFIGATDGELCEFGIGIIYEKTQKHSIWKLLHPHMLITAWRGMQILDRTTSIFNTTFSHAYYAGETKENSDVKRAIDELSKQIPNFKEFRESILGMKIDDEELDKMLRICNDPSNGISIFTNELKSAVEAGVINHTNEVTRAYEIEIEQQLQEEHDKAISKQPLPESKSFRKFCEKCGLRNLYGDPDDFFPSYRSLEQVDESLVFNGLRYKTCEMIWCAENSKEAFNHGHVGRPVLSLSDQRTVVLSAVRFLDNDMWGAIHVVKSECEDEWVKLSELSGLDPYFVGLTFSHAKNITPSDAARGYFATCAAKPKKHAKRTIGATTSP